MKICLLILFLLFILALRIKFTTTIGIYHYVFLVKEFPSIYHRDLFRTKHLWWSFFAKMVSGLYSTTVFSKMLQYSHFIGFKIRLSIGSIWKFHRSNVIFKVAHEKLTHLCYTKSKGVQRWKYVTTVAKYVTDIRTAISDAILVSLTLVSNT